MPPITGTTARRGASSETTLARIAEEEREQHIFEGRESLGEVKRLKDHPDAAAAKLIAGCAAQSVDVLTGDRRNAP